ncbi:MAG: class I SAM-dependent methyltransferase, partial [Acetobacteraceae bacterium]
SVPLGRPVDMAFLDGMHYAEFLLRDFINLERHVRRNSLVILHDCIPDSIEITARHIPPGAWAGDVWKVVLSLKKYRPDLRIHAVDSPPTGLVICTNLNPASRILEDRYFSILEDFAALDLGRIGIAGLRQLIGVAETDVLASYESVTRYFWL